MARELIATEPRGVVGVEIALTLVFAAIGAIPRRGPLLAECDWPLIERYPRAGEHDRLRVTPAYNGVESSLGVSGGGPRPGGILRVAGRDLDRSDPF